MNRTPRASQAGYTLLELGVSTVIAGLLGLAAVTMVQVGRKSHDTTRTETNRSQGVREASRALSDELKQCKLAGLTLGMLADGNCEITFARPISVTAGVITWGALDPHKAPSDPEARRAGWSVRWTVKALRAGTATSTSIPTIATDKVERVLVRQVLDEAKQVVFERIVLRDVNLGTNAHPGFRIEQVGTLWRVRMSAGGAVDPANSTHLTFDVALRN